MIHPTNNHLLIQPLKNTSFIASEKGTYEEVGIVLDNGGHGIVKNGDKIWFDSWLAGKYPTGSGNEFFWLVNWADVKAYEKTEDEKD